MLFSTISYNLEDAAERRLSSFRAANNAAVLALTQAVKESKSISDVLHSLTVEVVGDTGNGKPKAIKHLLEGNAEYIHLITNNSKALYASNVSTSKLRLEGILSDESTHSTRKKLIKETNSGEYWLFNRQPIFDENGSLTGESLVVSNLSKALRVVSNNNELFSGTFFQITSELPYNLDDYRNHVLSSNSESILINKNEFISGYYLISENRVSVEKLIEINKVIRDVLVPFSLLIFGTGFLYLINRKYLISEIFELKRMIKNISRNSLEVSTNIDRELIGNDAANDFDILVNRMDKSKNESKIIDQDLYQFIDDSKKLKLTNPIIKHGLLAGIKISPFIKFSNLSVYEAIMEDCVKSIAKKCPKFYKAYRYEDLFLFSFISEEEMDCEACYNLLNEIISISGLMELANYNSKITKFDFDSYDFEHVLSIITTTSLYFAIESYIVDSKDLSVINDSVIKIRDGNIKFDYLYRPCICHKRSINSVEVKIISNDENLNKNPLLAGELAYMHSAINNFIRPILENIKQVSLLEDFEHKNLSFDFDIPGFIAGRQYFVEKLRDEFKLLDISPNLISIVLDTNYLKIVDKNWLDKLNEVGVRLYAKQTNFNVEFNPSNYPYLQGVIFDTKNNCLDNNSLLDLNHSITYYQRSKLIIRMQNVSYDVYNSIRSNIGISVFSGDDLSGYLNIDQLCEVTSSIKKVSIRKI